MSLLTIKNLNKSYQNVQALSDVSLNIEANQVYGFIGKNGAGKTTTISILMALLKKDSGTIIFEGKALEWNDVSYKKKIGFVADVPTFPVYLTAHEFLDLSASFMGLDKDARKTKINSVLEFAELQHVNHKIGSYSRGMRQRLAIAAALLHDPILLVMDEPTSALDPMGRKTILNMVLKLKKTMAVFYSTHILEDAEKVCDRIGLIDQGRMMLEDDTHKILNNVRTEQYLLELLEENSVNEQILESFAGFKTIKMIQNNRFIFEYKEDGSQYSLFKYLNEHKLTITQYRKQTKSLEDVFLEVINANTP